MKILTKELRYSGVAVFKPLTLGCILGYFFLSEKSNQQQE
jgi:hypothetical protein